VNVLSDGILPTGRFLDNDSPHNFAKLGREFLEAAKFTHVGFQHVPTWPTLFLLFQSLELFLKAYLLAYGTDMRHIERTIGHKLCDALAEAKAKGLLVDVPKDWEDAIMAMSRHYTAKDFQYRSIGSWKQVFPDYVIAYVEAVAKAVKY
jgi:HEPN domain-containing protein